MIATIISFLFSACFASTHEIRLSDPQQVNSAAERIIRMIKERRPNVVLLGEDHRDSVTKAFYKSVIERVAERTGKRICYFHELAEDYQSALNGLSRPSEIAVRCFENRHSVLSRDFIEVFGRSPNHWLDVAQIAQLQQRGIRQFAVDLNQTREDLLRNRSLRDGTSGLDPIAAQIEFEDRIIRRRNEFMASRIRQIHTTENCEIGFLSVGSSHIFPPTRMWETNTQGGIARNLQPNLTSLKINARTCSSTIACSSEQQADLNIFFRQ